MFFDLNLPFVSGDHDLSQKLNFLHELGYNVVALNHSISGKLPSELVRDSGSRSGESIHD